jgi:HlyD family secretion protein
MACLALTLPLLAMTAACGHDDSAPTAVRVVRGTVDRTVSATGTLQPLTEQKLGFNEGGKLVALFVSVGQQVLAGQPLARIDDFDAQQDLQQAKAKLDHRQAALARLRDGDRTNAASDDAGHAKDVLRAIQDENDTLNQANNRAIEVAQKQLDDDRDALRQLQQEASVDQDRCNRSLTGGPHRYGGYGDYLDLASKGKKGLLLESPLDPKSPSCSRAEKGKSLVGNYQRRIQQDQRAIEANQRRADIDAVRQKVAVENARRDAAAAGDAADTAKDEAPHDIDAAMADVRDAQTDVRRAQREVANTTLAAPVAGTVSSINGQVGEFIGSGSGTTALAPGGHTALPDLDSGASSGADPSGDQNPTRPGGLSFITLKNINSFQMVVPFEETDAALVAPNQKVRVTFDALPDLERDGTVGTIAPTGAQIQDVNNYYGTILLNQTDPRLKGGMTAEAKVIVGGVDNVLVVPTAAVERGGNSGVVQVLQPNGSTRQVQVQLGLVGDSTTQVLAGVSEGQQVVVSPS